MKNFDWQKNKFYVILGGCSLAALILFLVIFLIVNHKPVPQHEIPDVEPIVIQSQGVVVQETPEKPVYTPEPTPRDKYIHYESDPSRNDYNKIKRKDSLQLNNVKQDMLKSIINKMFSDYRYTQCAYVYSDVYSGGEVCWMKFDDTFWRFKYFDDTKGVTADGAMKDFAYASEDDFHNIYRENSFTLENVDADIVASFIEYIYDRYQYTEYSEAGINWYWDASDKNGGDLQSYIIKFTNAEYTDYWVFTYRCNKYVEAHRDITGSIQ